MRYGIAMYCLSKPSLTLFQRIEELADMGFDVISRVAKELVRMDGGELGELTALLAARKLGMTIHSNFDTTPADAARVVQALGDSLLCFTFDAAMEWTSCGTSFHMAKMMPVLTTLEHCTRGTAVRFGLEDFPLDRAALEHYRADLGALADCPRFGTLIDIGHMHIRRTSHPYFAGQSERDYLANVPVPILEVHLHDNAGREDSHAYFGFGTVDFAKAAAGLKAAGFDGVATIEVNPNKTGETMEQTHDRLAPMLQQWRSLWQQA